VDCTGIWICHICGRDARDVREAVGGILGVDACAGSPSACKPTLVRRGVAARLLLWPPEVAACSCDLQGRDGRAPGATADGADGVDEARAVPNAKGIPGAEGIPLRPALAAHVDRSPDVARMLAPSPVGGGGVNCLTEEANPCAPGASAAELRMGGGVFADAREVLENAPDDAVGRAGLRAELNVAALMEDAAAAALGLADLAACCAAR